MKHNRRDIVLVLFPDSNELTANRRRVALWGFNNNESNVRQGC
jgi:hypothetical protein